MKLAVQSISGNRPMGLENAMVTMKNWNSAQAGMQSLRRSNTTKKKALNYNSREISSQLMRASKSRNAANVLAKAKSKVTMLQRCKGCGQYNDSEVEVALAHAKRMVKCAQLKVGNLKQEEALKKSSERKLSSSKQQKKNEVKRLVAQKENEIRQKAAMEELQQKMKKKECRRELAQKRRMHRNQEQSRIVEADMKYLQDQSNRNQGSYSASTGVSLELSGAAMSMSELQMLEDQIKMEGDLEMSMDVSQGMDGASGSSEAAGSGTVDVCL